MKPKSLIPTAAIEQLILNLRSQRVILDADLARLYGVTTKVLNQQVKRNAARFPADFMFRLTAAEKREVVTNCDHLKSLKFSPQKPLAFTEHGAIMAATLLNSPKAVAVSVYVVRAFVKLRRALVSRRSLRTKLGQLERTLNSVELKLGEHDQRFDVLFETLRELLDEPEDAPKPPIGFLTETAAS